MKKLMIPVLLLFTMILLSGCGSKEGADIEDLNKAQTSVENIQSAEVPDETAVEEEIVEEPVEEVSNAQEESKSM